MNSRFSSCSTRASHRAVFQENLHGFDRANLGAHATGRAGLGIKGDESGRDVQAEGPGGTKGGAHAAVDAQGLISGNALGRRDHTDLALLEVGQSLVEGFGLSRDLNGHLSLVARGDLGFQDAEAQVVDPGQITDQGFARGLWGKGQIDDLFLGFFGLHFHGHAAPRVVRYLGIMDLARAAKTELGYLSMTSLNDSLAAPALPSFKNAVPRLKRASGCLALLGYFSTTSW